MSRIEFDTTDAAMYCSTSDVARYFEQYDSFSTSTTPTNSEVKDTIKEWMGYIDRQTGHAWRENTVVEEMKDYDGSYRWWSGRALNLSKRNVRDFDSASGDKLEEWDGDTWNDWLTDSSFTKGRDNDYWMDNTSGMLWIKDLYWFRRRPQFRITYRYGNKNVELQIQQATAKLAAADLLTSDQYSMNVPGTDGAMGPEAAAQQWKEDAERTIRERKEVEYVDPY